MLPEMDLYVESLREVWQSQHLTNEGPKHVALERALKAFLGTSNLSLFNNGTLALVVACQALRLSGEVITTPFTFAATPHILSWNNITPVFADIDPVTMNIDPKRIENLITNRTTAILAVHVYGMPCDVDAIQAIADRHGLKVIYDGAHAFGTRLGGRPITQFGDATALSFHATKLFHSAEGGALIVQDAEIKTRVDLLKNFGIADDETVFLPGINGKMNELQAALGLLTLQMVDGEIARRKEISAIYYERLQNIRGLRLRVKPSDVELSQQYFPILIEPDEAGKTRDQVLAIVREFNVFPRKYFAPLCSEYSCYRLLPSSNPAYLPVAHRVAAQIMCLPFYGGLTNEDVYKICDILAFALRH